MPHNQAVTVGQLQREAREKLTSCGVESASLDARLLIQHELGISHEGLIADPARPVTDVDKGAIHASLERRLRHEPVSRIIGLREFFGREFIVTPDVLDPRPDTETLIEQVLAIAQMSAVSHIADLGTGSGAIIATLLAELPNSSGMATDVSAAALLVAEQNADRLGVGGRVRFVQTSWLDDLDGPFDVIVSNPPYIVTNTIDTLAPDVAHFDPRGALDGGADGLDAYRTIIPQAYQKLKPGGYLCFEVGAGQADDIVDLMASAGFVPGHQVEQRRRDLNGHVRVVSAQIR